MQQIDYQYYIHPLDERGVPVLGLEEESFSRTLPYGHLQLKRWRLDGIVATHTRSTFNGHYLFENKNALNRVGLEFNLGGRYEIHHLNKVYNVQGRQHNIIYTPSVDNTFINEDLYGESFKIHFQPEAFLEIVRESNDTLRRFADEITQGRPAVVAPVSPLIDPELARAIREIIECKFTGELRRVFIRSKCMEILVIQAEAFDRSGRAKNGRKVRLSENEAIHHARDYLIKNIDNPPGLAELAKIVGLNEYKLKRDFKRTFHTTVFGYLSEHRLEKARKELAEKQKSVAEIAYQLGYSSPQHFSAAFRKRFGVAPSKLNR